MTIQAEFNVINGQEHDPYRDRVERVYEEDPQLWRKVLGESLFFHHGVYDGADISLERAAANYLDAQLELAGLAGNETPSVDRVLDVGCGWGGVLEHLAGRFPECRRLDGVNISAQQLEYTGRCMREAGLDSRVKLFLCNAQDIALLPAPEWGYDLAIARGSVAHFTFDVLEKAIAGLGQRVRSGGTVVVAEVLYNQLDTYTSSVKDAVDRLGCKYRKSPEHVTSLLTRYGFTVTDVRVLPTDEDAIRWFAEVQRNIDVRFPQGAPLQALREYHVTASNMVAAVRNGHVSTYSIIAKRN